MVKISYPRYETKMFIVFLIGRGNVPSAIMNLNRIHLLFIKREINSGRSSDGSLWNRAIRTFN